MTAALPSSKNLASWVFAGFGVLFVLYGLQAYAVGPVPVDWIAQAGFIGLALVLQYVHPICLPTEFTGFKLFTLWVVVVTLVASGLRNYAPLMPPFVTSSYSNFMLLRFVAFAGFFSAGYVAWWLCREGLEERMIRFIKIVGTILAIAAIYMFFAHIYGLPEPPRTRLGTGGAEQVTHFGSEFQRAIGTFREPSHLAAWLLLPVLACMRKPLEFKGIPLLSMCAAILLSGSLTGLISISVALVGSMALFGWRSARVMASGFAVVSVLGLSILVYDFTATALGGSESAFSTMLVKRVTPLLQEKGLRGSNRDFIYKYTDTLTPGLAGCGWGNSDLLLAKGTNANLISSFSSLYLCTLVSTGYIGLVLIFAAIGWPLIRALLAANSQGVIEMTTAAAIYLAWISTYYGLYEELTLGFAIAVSLLAWRTRLGRLEKNALVVEPANTAPSLEAGT